LLINNILLILSTFFAVKESGKKETADPYDTRWKIFTSLAKIPARPDKKSELESNFFTLISFNFQAPRPASPSLGGS